MTIQQESTIEKKKWALQQYIKFKVTVAMKKSNLDILASSVKDLVDMAKK